MPASTLADYQAVHFKWRVADRVGFIETIPAEPALPRRSED